MEAGKQRPTGGLETEWRAKFARFAIQNDSAHLVSGWSAQGLHRRFTLFKDLLAGGRLPAPARVLDLGCGAGTYVRYLKALGHIVVGLDYSTPTLKRALAADATGSGGYLSAEAYRLPFRDNAFDLVISIGVLQVLGAPDAALREMARVVRPNGLLLIEFLNKYEIAGVLGIGGMRQVRAYSPFEVRRWLACVGVRQERRVGVYLLPRQLSWLGRVFDWRWLGTLFDAIPGVALVGAHAFMVCGVKKSKKP